MADPLDYLPYALAARNGSVDGIECGQLVAAGLTLLQRACRSCGRSRGGAPPSSCRRPRRSSRRSLPPRGVARCSSIRSRHRRKSRTSRGCGRRRRVHHRRARGPDARRRRAGAARRCAARSARGRGGTATDVDLGSHFGLDLEGDADAPGAGGVRHRLHLRRWRDGRWAPSSRTATCWRTHAAPCTARRRRPMTTSSRCCRGRTSSGSR